MSADHTDEFDDELPRRHRYVQCVDGFCGANDCPRCFPGNFRGGVYIDDLPENEETEQNDETD